MRENYKYDELGALELLNQLVSTKSIKLVKHCRNTISQLDKWNADVTKSVAEKDFGLCYALLNVVSELKDEIKPKGGPTPQMRSPYSSSIEQSNKPLYNKALLW